MSRGFAEGKRREWAERLERRRASGLTVARFCAREGVSMNTFYYWSKRLGSAGAAVSSRAEPRPARRGNPACEAAGPASAQAARPDADRCLEALAAAETLVRFHLGGGVTVEVPAAALEAIRCLAESVARPGAGEARAETALPKRSGVFHELVLGSRR